MTSVPGNIQASIGHPDPVSPLDQDRIDHNMSEAPASQHEPFERRQLVKLMTVLNEVGVHNELASHSIDASELLQSFFLESATNQKVKTPFSETKHPLLLGLVLGLRVRERGGTTGRGVTGAGTFTTNVELVDTKLQRAAETWEGSLELVVRQFKHRSNQLNNGDQLTDEIPGFSTEGMRLIVEASFGYSLSTETFRGLGDAERKRLEKLALNLFITGLQLGLLLRRREGQRYSRSAAASRRPQAFFVTSGFDYLGESDASRAAHLVGSLTAQGASDMAWWPLYSNQRPGDLVLLSARPLDPGTIADKEWVCDTFKKHDPDCAGETRCVLHQAWRNRGQEPELPGLNLLKEDLQKCLGRLGTPGNAIWGLGLITAIPNWRAVGGAENTFRAWRGRVGFIRWLPAPVDPSRLEDLDGRPLLPTPAAKVASEYLQMSYLQFDSSTSAFTENISFAGKRWSMLRDQLTASLMDEALPSAVKSAVKASSVDPGREDLERRRWSDDLSRLMLCSENLALGASVESLGAVAPPVSYPLALYKCLDEGALKEQQDRDEIWQRELDNGWSDDLSVGTRSSEAVGTTHSMEDMKGVVSSFKGATSVERAPLLDPETDEPRYSEGLGRHEAALVETIGDRCSSLIDKKWPERSYALVLLPSTLSSSLAHALSTPGVEQRLYGNHPRPKMELDPQMLIPLDPAWTERRVMWRFRLPSNKALYLGLVAWPRASLEGSILQRLIELNHAGGKDRLGHLDLALGIHSSSIGTLTDAHMAVPRDEREFIDRSIHCFRSS